MAITHQPSSPSAALSRGGRPQPPEGSARLAARAAGRGRGGAAPASRPGRPAGFALGSQESEPAAAPNPGARTYPFHGVRQAGIVTPMQDRLHFAAFDVITDDRATS